MAEYFESGELLFQEVKRDVKAEHSLKLATKMYDNLWEVAKTDFGLIKKELSVKKNNDDLWIIFAITWWKDKKLQEVFFKDHWEKWFDTVRKSGFVFKHEIHDTSNSINDIYCPE